MPYADKAIRTKYQMEWRKRHPEVGRLWRERHPAQWKEIQHSYDARKRYGLTLEQRTELRKRACEICGKHAKKMCIDHIHALGWGHYRGVLCQQCNTRLGWLEKNTEAVNDYLQREPRDASTIS